MTRPRTKTTDGYRIQPLLPMSFHYFGGSQGVTAGTFTIIWHANGINRYTLT